MKEKIKLITIAIIIIATLGYAIAKANEKTETVRACVTNCDYVADDCYEVTVEYNHSLWVYYDSLPREKGGVLMVTYNEDYDIVDAREIIEGR